MRRSKSKRESKKPKTKWKPDRRPHLGIYIPRKGWVSNEELKPTKEEKKLPDAYWYPGRDTNPPGAWSKQDAQSLIDMYAAVCWGTNSNTHNEMTGNVTHFRSLYKKQKGKCAITGTPIYGGPGLHEHGIGIDLLVPKRGARRGNIRLISAPLAITRFLHQSYPDYGKPLNPQDFEGYPITWVVYKQLQQTIIQHKSFKYWPIVFKWDVPRSQRMRKTRTGFRDATHSVELLLNFLDVRVAAAGLNSYRKSKIKTIKCAELWLEDDRFHIRDHSLQLNYISLVEPIDFVEYFVEYFSTTLVETYKSRGKHG
jgi:hypothetical protein